MFNLIIDEASAPVFDAAFASEPVLNADAPFLFLQIREKTPENLAILRCFVVVRTGLEPVTPSM